MRLNKLEDEETGDIYYTAVACHLLNPATGRCSDYENRLQRQFDCPICAKPRPATTTAASYLCIPAIVGRRGSARVHPLVSGDSEQVTGPPAPPGTGLSVKPELIRMTWKPATRGPTDYQDPQRKGSAN